MTRQHKSREALIDESIPRIDQFIESREAYIKALETTISALKQENAQSSRNNLAIRNSIDEMVAMQQLSNIISTAVDPELILNTLIELTQEVIPVLESNIFLFDATSNKLLPFSAKSSERLNGVAQQQLEVGIVDWVISEKKTVIIPDLDSLKIDGTSRNFVLVPLILRNRPIGVYIIHTPKPQQEFSNHDIQLLTVLANEAAAGVENWNTHRELMKVNEELKVSKTQMVQAAKLAAIGELAAGILHEIKNPVQVLMMNVELMKKGRKIPNWEELMATQVTRLMEITRRLTSFSRNVSEEPKMEPVDINKTVLEIIDMVQHQFRNEKIIIERQLAERMPQILGNANALQQVFLNLLINARDAMPNGGTCTIITESRDFTATVRFSDTGVGIEPHLQKKIFDPFFTTKEAGKGTGLGLSICKTIVSQHHGEILVDSQPGSGTTFSIILPIRRSL